MSNSKQGKDLSKMAIQSINLLDFPDDILRHITTFYERNELLGIITACKKLYTMPFVGYIDKKNKYIQVVVVLDTTGSMGMCIENLKPSILMILVKAKEEYPEYTVLFSIVEYGDVDTCFDVETEQVKGQNKVADITYRPGSHFISIQCPLRVFDKIYQMLSDLQLRGGGGPEALDQAIIHLEKEFRSSWVGCRQPYSSSVDYVIFLGDVVGHNMGNDKDELFLDFFGQHGQSKDWFAPLKKLYKKNVVFIHLGLTTNLHSEPAVHQHFGCIVAALGGYSFNISENDVFDIPRIVIDLMGPELATRAIIQKAHIEAVNKICGASKQQIKKVIMEKLDEFKSSIQSANFDQRIMNKGSTQMEKKIQDCNTLEDLEKQGLMPTRETIVFLARLNYGSFTNIGEIDKTAAKMGMKRKRSSQASIILKGQLPKQTDQLGISMGQPALRRQLTGSPMKRAYSRISPLLVRNCSTPLKVRETRGKSVVFSSALGNLSEDGNISSKQIIQRNFGLVRMQTQSYTPRVSGHENKTNALTSPDILSIFRDSPWRELMQDVKKIKLFLSGSKAPVPARLQIGLVCPRTVFKMPIGKLECAIRKDDLKIARKKLILAQPFQKPIIDAYSFGKHCENLNPTKPSKKVRRQASIDDSFEPNDNASINATLVRTNSVFVPDIPTLYRSMTSVDSTNSQALRNLNCQFE
jgi:hypothetical protein